MTFDPCTAFVVVVAAVFLVVAVPIGIIQEIRERR